MKMESRDLSTPVLVIDIGGTSFRSSLFEEGKLIGNPFREQTPNFINHPNLQIVRLQNLLVNKIVDTVRKYKEDKLGLKQVGISFPAPITSKGVVTQACTVWGDKGKNFPLGEKLKKLLPKIKFTITNDITAAAERYSILDKYKKVDYFAIITVSSGIGGKIYDVKNQHVILDKRSVGGEMGHVRLDFSPDAPLCDCGGRGHLGAISSGRAVEKLTITCAKKYPEKYKLSLLHVYCPKLESITNNYIVSAIKKNDAFSLNVLDKTTFFLAQSISHISGNIGADKYIIIGGFALNCGEPYIKSLRRNLQKVDFYGRERSELKNIVELGVNDDNACLIGIGLLTQKEDANTITQ